MVYSMTLDLLCVTRQGIEKHNNLQIQRMWFKQFYAKGHSLIFEYPHNEESEDRIGAVIQFFHILQIRIS